MASSMRPIIATGFVVLMVGAAIVQAHAQETALPGKSQPSVERRQRLLEDKDEIRELLIAYGRDFDKRDFKAYSNLFASDGVWVGGAQGSQPYTGPAVIREFVTKTYPPSSYPGSFHIMSSMSIQILGENTARAWSRWTYLVLGAHGEPTPFAAGHYEDTLVRAGGVWKFKRREAFAAAAAKRP
jgi:uncharacterized protein (TIGR02246 family)